MLRRHAIPRRLPGHIKMAEMINDQAGKAQIQKAFDKAGTVSKNYGGTAKTKRARNFSTTSPVLIRRPERPNTDVWTNQLDALWYLIAMARPFIPEDGAKKILKTIYKNNEPSWAGPCARRKTANRGIGSGKRRLYNFQLRLRPVVGLLTAWSKRAKTFTSTWTGSCFDCGNPIDTGQPPGRAGEGSGRVRPPTPLYRRSLSRAGGRLDSSLS